MMPEWLYVAGQVVLWILLGIAVCFTFTIVMACGQYEFRVQRRKREPRPAGQKPNPPKVDTNVQPPPTCRHCGGKL